MTPRTGGERKLPAPPAHVTLRPVHLSMRGIGWRAEAVLSGTTITLEACYVDPADGPHIPR